MKDGRRNLEAPRRTVSPDEAVLLSRQRQWELAIMRAIGAFERWAATPGADRLAVALAADWAGTRLGDAAKEKK